AAPGQEIGRPRQALALALDRRLAARDRVGGLGQLELDICSLAQHSGLALLRRLAGLGLAGADGQCEQTRQRDNRRPAHHASAWRATAAREPMMPIMPPNASASAISRVVKNRSEPAANSSDMPRSRNGPIRSKASHNPASASAVPSRPWTTPSTTNGPRTKRPVPPTNRKI